MMNCCVQEDVAYNMLEIKDEFYHHFENYIRSLLTEVNSTNIIDEIFFFSVNGRIQKLTIKKILQCHLPKKHLLVYRYLESAFFAISNYSNNERNEYNPREVIYSN